MVKRLDWYKNKRFLIVSEVVEFRLHLQAMLESFGAQRVLAVRDPQSALESYQRRPPDFVITDYHFNQSLSGLQLLRRLQDGGHYKFGSRFIVCCGERDIDEARAELMHSPDDIWVTPLKKAQVRTHLDNLLVQKAAMRPIDEALDKRQYQLAIQVAQEKLGRVPKIAMQCLRVMALAFIRQGDFAQAESMYERILANAELDWALLGQAFCQLESGHHLDCIENCDRVLARHNHCIDAYIYKAQALEFLGELQQAADQLSRAAEFARFEPKLLRRLGHLSLRIRDPQTHSSCYRRLIQLAEQDSTVQLTDADFVNYARGLFAMFVRTGPVKGKRFLSELQDVLRKQSRRVRDNPQIALPFQLITARMLVQQSAKDEAGLVIDEVLDSCLQLQPELLLREEVELTYEACPELPEAMKLHQQVNAGDSVIYAVEPDPERSQKLNREGMALFQKQLLNSAKQRFIDAFRYAPDNVSVALNLLQTLLKLMEQQGRNDDDIDRCRRCVLSAQALPSADNRRGHLDVLKVKLNHLRFRPDRKTPPNEEVSHD